MEPSCSHVPAAGDAGTGHGLGDVTVTMPSSLSAQLMVASLSPIFLPPSLLPHPPRFVPGASPGAQLWVSSSLAYLDNLLVGL